MKPTIWKYCDEWHCAVIRGNKPKEGTKEFAFWSAAGSGSSIEEAYAYWMIEVERNLKGVHQ